jgi:hypothetical protein
MWAGRVTINTLTIIPRTRLTLIMLGGSSHRPLSHNYPLASTLAPASAHHVSRSSMALTEFLLGSRRLD